MKTKLSLFHIVLRREGRIIKSFKTETAAKNYKKKLPSYGSYSRRDAYRVIKEWNRPVRLGE